MPTALVLTLLLFLLLSGVGAWLAHRHPVKKNSWWIIFFLALMAVPAFLYAGYYWHLVDEPIFLYRLRSLPGSELLAGLIGLPFGWIGMTVGRHRIRVIRLSVIGLAIAPMLVLLPYTKEILNPLDHTIMKDHWSENICLQSTSSTCGPSAAATVLRSLGQEANESELAIAAHTSASGTEIWYLARALRSRGLAISFMATSPNPSTLPYPAIAGTRIGNELGTGHFIAVLDREGDRYIIGDPMIGRQVLSPAEMTNGRFFTGFFLRIGKQP
jgi:predicted double-glycine peptidase